MENKLTMIEKYSEMFYQQAVIYLPKLALALVTLLIGWMIIGFIRAAFLKYAKKVNMDASLSPFLVGIISVLLKVMLLVAVAGMVGIQTTSFVAVLGAAGLAVGLALQGSLANFAGSVLLLFFRPYKVGDYVQINGESGTVLEIQIFSTKLATLDNVIIFVPNGPAANSSIKNYSSEPLRRVDSRFGIGYGDDIDAAREAFQRVIDRCDKKSDQKPTSILLSSLDDSAVTFAVRVWTKPEHYWEVFHWMQEEVKKELDRSNISIPFPQRDVHLIAESNSSLN